MKHNEWLRGPKSRSEWWVDKPEILTIEEIAQYLRVNYQTIYKMVKRGIIPGFKVGSKYRVKREALDGFMRGDFKKYL